MTQPSAWTKARVRAAVVTTFLILLACGCRRMDKPRSTVAPVPRQTVTEDLGYLRTSSIGNPLEGRPWIAHINALDLDRDGRMDAVACEAQESKILWLRQTAPGVFEERVLAADMRAPVHVEPADMDGDGDTDLIVSSMGQVFPNNDKIGTIFILENDGRQGFTPHIVIENTARVTDVRAADFNRDGRLDLAVGQFGYDQGEMRWMERTGPWEFRSHMLLELSGAINVGVADFNGDGSPDIVGLISQQWEEIHLFTNDGTGKFTGKVIWGSTNEDYGSSGISLADLNRDGRMDVLYSNGDGFGPAVVPGPRPWHGVQWLENTGGGNFRYHRIGDLPGAYSPIAVDLDGDGALDVVACAAYAAWDRNNTKVVSMMWFKNDGRMNFAPRILAYAPRDVLTLSAADFDGSGRPSIVSGCFPVYPPYDFPGRFNLWQRAAP